jgi:hypothetical protein
LNYSEGLMQHWTCKEFRDSKPPLYPAALVSATDKIQTLPSG